MGERYLKNLQIALNMLLQHLCNNKANLLTRFEPCWNKILGTRPRMTGARGADLVLVVVFVIPLTRSDAPISPARDEVIILVLNVLLPKVSFFLPKPVKTC